MRPTSTSQSVVTIQQYHEYSSPYDHAHNQQVNLYLKKRPSPIKGVTVFKKKDSPFKSAVRKTPKDVIAAEIQRQRQAQYIALERELNALFEQEYAQDIHTYMKQMEKLTIPSVEMMDMQPELEWYMRPFLVDFINEVHQQFRLQPETLYLTFNIIDRYISKRVVYRKHYQLVGCTALWIAAKFEDSKDRVPTVKDLSLMCCHAYEESAFIQMEGHVLNTIGWLLGHPTAEAFLRLECKQQAMQEAKIKHVAQYLMETTLYHRDFAGLGSSVVANGALTLARNICGKVRTLKSRPAPLEVLRCAQLINDFIADSPCEPISKIVHKKYSHNQFSRAANIVKDWYYSGGRFNASEDGKITISKDPVPKWVVSNDAIDSSFSSPRTWPELQAF